MAFFSVSLGAGSSKPFPELLELSKLRELFAYFGLLDETQELRIPNTPNLRFNMCTAPVRACAAEVAGYPARGGRVEG
jgi:hypothetical protein